MQGLIFDPSPSGAFRQFLRIHTHRCCNVQLSEKNMPSMQWLREVIKLEACDSSGSDNLGPAPTSNAHTALITSPQGTTVATGQICIFTIVCFLFNSIYKSCLLRPWLLVQHDTNRSEAVVSTLAFLCSTVFNSSLRCQVDFFWLPSHSPTHFTNTISQQI